jgi:uncharacterized repeat protein (TIGR01451 family)
MKLHSIRPYRLAGVIILAAALLGAMHGLALAKSIYVIAGINAYPDTPIRAYNINPDGTLTFQAEYGVSYLGWGAVGLAIDTASEVLFITYEASNTITLVDAKTMTGLGTTTAPGAYNLAGIVMDEAKKLLYIVDRGTSNLYVYRWDAAAKTLTLVAQPALANLGGAGAFGIGLDKKNNHLYVANLTNVVNYYDTNNWSHAGSITVPGAAINVAIDEKNGLVYSGAGWGQGNNYLDQYNQATGATNRVFLGTGVGVHGLGVDINTSNVYCTTGYNGDDLRAYNSALTLLHNAGWIGNDPTGLAIPTTDVSYNPLNLNKTGSPDPVAPGNTLTYTITYDNANNQNPVTDVVLVDQLPPETTFVSATNVPLSQLSAEPAFFTVLNQGTYDPATHRVTWNIGTLAAGAATQTLQLVVRVKADTTTQLITNYATIVSTETPISTKSANTNVSLAGGILRFPLPGYTPYTAPVSAVLDNSVLERTPVEFYVPGDIIKTFNGEVGEKQYGVIYLDPWGLYWPAYMNSTHTNFFPPSPAGVRPLNYINGAYLSYAGMPGYNYKVPEGTPVLATANGLLYKAVTDPVNGAGYEYYANSYIAHDNGFYSWYLYAPLTPAILAEINQNGYAQVTKGQVIGNTIGTHLHFEVRYNGSDHQNVVDPYKLGLWQTKTGFIEPVMLLLLGDAPPVVY